MLAFRLIVFSLLTVVAAACGGGGGGGGTPGQEPSPTPTQTPGAYQPLAVGDRWSYACHFRNPPKQGTFPIANDVSATQAVNGVQTYAFDLQIVTSPSQIATETMLLANDAKADTILYGYLQGGTVLPVTPTVIVPANPTQTSYNYPGPDGKLVSRIFKGFTVTNPTPLGTFNVAVYYESGATHNYGYAAGKGIMEEDHGPNFQYDCLITALHLQ